MKIDEDEPLRRAFAAGSERPGRGEGQQDGCPAPDVLWAAAAGELPPAERRQVIDHTSRCAACAEDFRIAAEMVRASPAAAPAAAHAAEAAAAPAPSASGKGIAGRWGFSPAERRPQRWLYAALAATLLLGVLAAGLWKSLQAPEVQRGDDAEIVSRLGEAPRLPREDVLLRWKGPAGARYVVVVTTPELLVVDQQHDLAAESYRVPPEKLAGLPPGAAIDWRVEGVLPDGRRLSSPLFRFVLEE